MGSFVHAVEDEMLCSSVMTDKVPYFNAPIYLQNKSVIGKVDEILGPINQVYFSVKMGEGMVAASFKKGDKVYIGGDKLLPIERFLPKPKVIGGMYSFPLVNSIQASHDDEPLGTSSIFPAKPTLEYHSSFIFSFQNEVAVAVVEGLVVVVELPTAEGDFSVVECVEVAVEGQGLVVTGEEGVVHLEDSMAVEQVAAEGGEVAAGDGEVVGVEGGVHRSLLNLAIMYTLP